MVKNYKVVIPCAGIGSRLNEYTIGINKSLVSIGTKPIISYLIEKFDENIEIIIPIGYKGDIVKQYCQLMYPDRNIVFVEIANYNDVGSGLGATLLECEKYLQCPFIFCANDTIVENKIPIPSRNWIGYSNKKKNKNLYRKIVVNKNNTIKKILDKDFDENGSKIYIGLAGIYDYNLFWEEMKNGTEFGSISMGESYALSEMIKKNNVYAKKFIWNDVGNINDLEEAKKQSNSKIVVLDKKNESIWINNNKVIKYFSDPNIVKMRIERNKILGNIVPQIKKYSENMYCYDFISGNTLSEKINIEIFDKLLNEYKNKFLLTGEYKIDKNIIENFYFQKTEDRINLFLKSRNIIDDETIINYEKIPSIKTLINKIDKNSINNICFSKFHGDFHFENIIIDDTGNFKYLDWRQDFGGETKFGDAYYDFGKLLHGLIISHRLIKNNLFEIDIIDDNNVNFNYFISSTYLDLIRNFYLFIKLNNFEKQKIDIICSLIFLNISPLHEKKYGDFLFYLGKYMLFKSLGGENNV